MYIQTFSENIRALILNHKPCPQCFGSGTEHYYFDNTKPDGVVFVSESEFVNLDEKLETGFECCQTCLGVGFFNPARSLLS